MDEINTNIHAKRCLNCQSELDSGFNYCPNCGAHQLKGRLSIKEVLTELFDVILIWDKNFFKTFFHLLICPSRVITFYIKGGRNRYLNPLLYLLFCFFLYFLIASLLNKDLFFMGGMKGGVAGWNSVDPGALNLNSINSLNRFSKILYFLILPIFAFLSSIFFRSSRLNFGEHLIINAYLLGEITLVGTVALPLTYLPFRSIGILALILMIYMFLGQYQVYQNKVLKSLLKSLLFMVLSIFAILLLYGLIAVTIAYLASN